MNGLIKLVLFVGIVGGGAYVYLFKWDEWVRGYPLAKTPTEAIDQFKKAIEARDYKMAARYCSKEYADQLKKADEAASKLGKAIDNLRYRFEQGGIKTSEMDFVLFLHDPFPKNVDIIKGKETESQAEAKFSVSPPNVQEARTNWDYDKFFVQALYAALPSQILISKQNDHWVLAFPVSEPLQLSVNRLVSNYRDYQVAFEKLAVELRQDPSTKEDARTRFQKLLNDAVHAQK